MPSFKSLHICWSEDTTGAEETSCPAPPVCRSRFYCYLSLSLPRGSLRELWRKCNKAQEIISHWPWDSSSAFLSLTKKNQRLNTCRGAHWALFRTACQKPQSASTAREEGGGKKLRVWRGQHLLCSPALTCDESQGRVCFNRSLGTEREQGRRWSGTPPSPKSPGICALASQRPSPAAAPCPARAPLVSPSCLSGTVWLLISAPPRVSSF